jgi:hypothetical protein
MKEKNDKGSSAGSRKKDPDVANPRRGFWQFYERTRILKDHTFA